MLELDTFVDLIRPYHEPGRAHGDRSHRLVDCQANVNSYDTIITITELDMSGSSEELKHVYDVYLTAIDLFVEGATPWTEGCRQALAEGIMTKELFQNHFVLIHEKVAASKDLLNQVYTYLLEQ